MLFNSISFLIFFSVVTTLYFALPHKYRWLLLLLSSCYFYMAFVPVYILILGFTIVIDYFAGILIEQATGKRRRFLLICSLVANIGILAVFKYYNFINANITALLGGFHRANPFPYLTILLPIGLSFHTFQAMSYTIEVYRGNQKPERHFGIYALYVMFYPQLVAGPIERPQNLLHQFYEKHYIDYKRITDGLKLMAWGLFKKIVIADRLATVVDNVYDDPYHHHGLSFLIATVFFSFQIFCDFSGYADMAIGMAKVMGFTLMKNFNSPYHAKSIREFWARWHISLSTWFKDYLYFPLGGNRVGRPRWYLNLIVVFLVSGLWHGASWTFIVWGALHGMYMVFAQVISPLKNKLRNMVKLKDDSWFYNTSSILITFMLVTFAWIFFRAKSIGVAIYVVKGIFTETLTDVVNIIHHRPSHVNLGLVGQELWIGVLGIVLLEVVHLLQKKHSVIQLISYKPTYVRWIIYYAFLFALITLNVSGGKQFIYFQF